jgi:hypothetical protein
MGASSGGLMRGRVCRLKHGPKIMRQTMRLPQDGLHPASSSRLAADLKLRQERFASGVRQKAGAVSQSWIRLSCVTPLFAHRWRTAGAFMHGFPGLRLRFASAPPEDDEMEGMPPIADVSAMLDYGVKAVQTADD